MEDPISIPALELAELINGEIKGDPKISIDGVCSVQNLSAQKVTFLQDRKFISKLPKISDSLVIVEKSFETEDFPNTFIFVDNPRTAFAKIASKFLDDEKKWGIHPTAVVHPTAVIHPQSSIGPYCIIEKGVKVGQHTVLVSHVYLGANTHLGDRVTIYNGAVLGGPGFGFIQVDGKNVEVPQVGQVVVEDDVRIGANCTIDRASIDKTILKKGTKLDNLVHVGHNAIIGENNILCAQVGIAGSCELGNNVAIGGQGGVSDHITIGENVKLGAQTGVFTNLAPNDQYFLTPAVPMSLALRMIKYLRKLPDLWLALSKKEKA
jgi:UDP-3-O-[3-hydroxymyristoyl] glucosamine N-acyltransferase